MNLREELSSRLSRISGPMFGGGPWPKWDEMADECLRQMHYNARFARGECAICGPPPNPHITLAPEDWIP